MSEWRREPKTLVHENPFFRVHRTTARSSEAEKTYFVVDFGRRAGIVLLDQSRVLLVRQYRYLANGHCWEIPGGTVDENENPEIAAIRETLEETGIRCRKLEPLMTYYPSLDNVDNRTFLYLCRHYEVERPFTPNPREIVEIRWVDINHALSTSAVGEVHDGFTALALFAARERMIGK